MNMEYDTDYDEVARDIKKRNFGNPVNFYSFTAEARFKELREIYKG